ncbi:MAG: flagellar type III secretion system protein FlhB [Acidobacteriota bacterium]
MADQASGGDQTEKPSAQKLRKAREQGQVPRSKDLATAVGLLVAIKLTIVLMPGYLDDFRVLFVQTLADLGGEGSLQNLGSIALPSALWLLIKMILPLMVVPMAVIVASVVPGGLTFNASHFVPKLNRLSPLSNLGRLGSGKHWVGVFTSVLKAAVLGALVYHLSLTGVDAYVRLQGSTLGPALLGATALLTDSVMAMCAVFVIFALIDVPVQHLLFMRGQRMSKQELKEEYKSQEGRPEVRQRIRQLQRALARRSIHKTVPGADVVIVNPEHYAVALKYDDKRAEAPFVVAKGVDEMALYIRQIAAEHAIEVVPIPPLARAIYNTSQVNQQIPATLYKAVALVLTYVLQLDAFRQGRRPYQPALPTDLAVPEHLT